VAAASAFDHTSHDDIGNSVLESQFLLFDSDTGVPVGYGANFNTAKSPVDDIEATVEAVCANANQVFAKTKQARHKVDR